MRYRWDKATRQFVTSDGEALPPRPLRIAIVRCATCGFREDDEVLRVGDSIPDCPVCESGMSEVTDFAETARRIHGQADYLPGGGFEVGGKHFERRSDLNSTIRDIEARTGKKVELSNPSLSQRRAENDAIRQKVEDRRRAQGFTTEDVKRVDAERRAARMAGATHAEVLHKPAAKIIKGE